MPADKSGAAIKATWSNLTSKFSKLAEIYRDNLSASYGPYGFEGKITWRLSSTSARAKEQFKWAAEEAALELGYKGSEGLNFWLNRLKRDRHFWMPITSSGYDADGHQTAQIGIGTILRVAVASAEYCLNCQNLMQSPERMKTELWFENEVAVADRVKPGPVSDEELMAQLADIVFQVGGQEWRKHQEEICERLDAAGIAVPSRWRKLGMRCWADCDDRTRFQKTIAYRIGCAQGKN